MNLAAFAKVMSEKLVKQLADAGLSSLHAVLEHLGILTFSCDSVAWESVFFFPLRIFYMAVCVSHGSGDLLHDRFYLTIPCFMFHVAEAWGN